MDIVVQKFGGASVKTADCIKQVASIIAKEWQKQSAVVAVVSAMAHVTDSLVKKTREITNCLYQDSQLMECDTVVSAGEQISSALLALALQDLGFKARSWLAWQIPLKSDSSFGEARITHVATQRIYESLNRGEIPVVAGFQSINENNRITTLGRGGTDVTALAIAAAISASRCDLFKEVTGIFTADPCIIGEAKKLDFISYAEMLELSSGGARVLHSRAVEIAMRYKIPTKIMPSFTESSGTTLIEKVEVTKDNVITAITHSTNEALVSVVGISTLQEVENLISLFGTNKVSTDLIIKNFTQDQTSFTFTVLYSKLSSLKKLLRECQKSVECGKITVNEEVSRVSLIGSGIQSYPETIRNALAILAEKKIEILLLSSSEIKLSIFVHKKDVITAMQVLHKFFITP
ncbi:MAG: aspartate kinase [Rickettsiales bacterium]|nr:aspartate kinase [Rickettsiales bacterium]